MITSKFHNIRDLLILFIFYISVAGCASPPPYNLNLPWDIQKFDNIKRDRYSLDRVGEWLFYFDIAVNIERESKKSQAEIESFLWKEVINGQGNTCQEGIRKAVQNRDFEDRKLEAISRVKAREFWLVLREASFYRRCAAVIVAELYKNAKPLIDELEKKDKIREISELSEKLPPLALNLANNGDYAEILNKAFRQLIKKNEELREPFAEDVECIIKKRGWMEWKE